MKLEKGLLGAPKKELGLGGEDGWSTCGMKTKCVGGGSVGSRDLEEQSREEGQDKQSVYCGIIIKPITSSPNF